MADNYRTSHEIVEEYGDTFGLSDVEVEKLRGWIKYETDILRMKIERVGVNSN